MLKRILAVIKVLKAYSKERFKFIRSIKALTLGSKMVQHKCIDEFAEYHVLCTDKSFSCKHLSGNHDEGVSYLVNILTAWLCLTSTSSRSDLTL